MIRDLKLCNSSSSSQEQNGIQLVQHFGQINIQLFRDLIDNNCQLITSKYTFIKQIYHSQLSQLYKIVQSSKMFSTTIQYYVLKLSKYCQRQINPLQKFAGLYFPQLISTVKLNNQTQNLKGFIMNFYQENLKQIIQRNIYGVHSSIILNVLRSLTEGIKILHFNNVVHGDLKSQNILYCNKTNKFIIADLGNSFFFNIENKQQELPTQTIHYRSYEAIYKRGTSKIDIWSIGCIIYQCLTGNSLIPSQVLTEAQLECFFQELQMDWKKYIHFMLSKWVFLKQQIDLYEPLLYGTLQKSEFKRWDIKQLTIWVQQNLFDKQ